MIPVSATICVGRLPASAANSVAAADFAAGGNGGLVAGAVVAAAVRLSRHWHNKLLLLICVVCR